VSGNATGYRLPHAPDFSANLSLNYRIPAPIGLFEVSGNYKYTSSYAWDVDNRLRQAAYGLVNATLSWTSRDDAWKVRLWTKNLFDKKY
jgi:iron complex outermembrane receptor protein